MMVYMEFVSPTYPATVDPGRDVIDDVMARHDILGRDVHSEAANRGTGKAGCNRHQLRPSEGQGALSGCAEEHRHKQITRES